MGFISAFANFGSIGSTTKWAIKMFNQIKSENKKLNTNQIFSMMVKARIQSMPFGSNKYGLDYESHMIQFANHAPGLAGLIIEILNTEAELSENSASVINDMIKPIFDKLEDTDLSTKEKYGHIKNKSEWVMFIYNFLDRVSR
ncbi:hypothetical protein OAM05_01335 [Candidatus Pelagibacter sp.]|nr:hypothetical protein [Candidatus Pelagibacter sp.]|tara:strand:+ start:164 stop:592 length:429 start_codon:yes stop_codon:yes gene_type:complete